MPVDGGALQPNAAPVMEFVRPRTRNVSKKCLRIDTLATFSASMMRAASPPEATDTSGRRGSEVPAAKRSTCDTI